MNIDMGSSVVPLCTVWVLSREPCFFPRADAFRPGRGLQTSMQSLSLRSPTYSLHTHSAPTSCNRLSSHHKESSCSNMSMHSMPRAA